MKINEELAVLTALQKVVGSRRGRRWDAPVL